MAHRLSEHGSGMSWTLSNSPTVPPPRPSAPAPRDSVETLQAAAANVSRGTLYSLRVSSDATILTDRTTPMGSISVIFASQGPSGEQVEPGLCFGLLVDYGSHTKVVVRTLTQFQRLRKQLEHMFPQDDFPKISKSTNPELRRSSLEDFVRMVNKNPKMRFSFHFRLFADELDLRGKYYIVTGANSGIGFEVTRYLAKSGATVIMACRNADRCAAAIADIKREAAAAHVEFLHLDLASMNSVAKFAFEYKKKAYPVHGLVLNAGIAETSVSHTEDDLEMFFGINYLGHALLFHLLLPILREANKCRVIVASSSSHTSVKQLVLSEKHGRRKAVGQFLAYAESKLCCLMFSREIAERYPPWISGVTAIALNPGPVCSTLYKTYKNTPGALQWGPSKHLLNPLEGALATLTATLSEDLEGSSNLYLDDLGLPSSSASSLANDRNAWKMLWDATLEFISPGIDEFQRLEDIHKEENSSLRFEVLNLARHAENAIKGELPDEHSPRLASPLLPASITTSKDVPKDSIIGLSSQSQSILPTSLNQASLSPSLPRISVSSSDPIPIPSPKRPSISSSHGDRDRAPPHKSSDSYTATKLQASPQRPASPLSSSPDFGRLRKTSDPSSSSALLSRSSPYLSSSALPQSVALSSSSPQLTRSFIRAPVGADALVANLDRARSTSLSIRATLHPNSWDYEVAEMTRILSKKEDSTSS